jgi:ABC-type multidrug transport system fused ATPase/permease subunit
MKPKEKIGVVGRTGAGKSTLSSAFFRIIPFSAGEITIDGIDISKFGVRDLRSRLTIIPQDPILFEGTLRNNLDPLNECSDAQLWEALKLTNVLESFESNGSTQTITLDALVNENGTNFSQGQRQLVCLARALLRSSKFIVMDEATASVDPDTDSKIQKTIRSEFKDCTILTIAHRLKTVIDYDRIIVLDDGKIKEIGTAEELLAMKGVFFDMCVDSGDFNELLLIARENSRINE